MNGKEKIDQERAFFFFFCGVAFLDFLILDIEEYATNFIHNGDVTQIYLDRKLILPLPSL